MEKEINHKYTDEVVCPYCGYEHSDCWEFSDFNDEFECSGCKELFVMQRNVEITYSTKKITNHGRE